MVCPRLAFFVIFLTFSLDEVDLLENGLARTPPMGWMSWGFYMCGVKCEDNPDKCLNETLILSVVDTFYTEGYQEAGYEYIIIDDCWSEKRRDEFGKLVPDKKRFPNGMKYIADYIHARGLKFGMYTNIAAVTCMGYPGSRGHFAVDAVSFADWDVDYLKVDGCFVEEDFLNVGYIKLSKHLDLAGRPMVYSCSWPYYIKFIHHKMPNYTEIAKHCNLWRNFHDVVTSWDSIVSIVTFYRRNYDELAPHHGPGGWNDPDMLIFGTNILTRGQSRVQLTVYAMLSAPLLLSCDMSKMKQHEKELLLNLDLMAIAQDALGIMAKPYDLHGLTLWLKPHLPMKGNSYLSYSFAIVNLMQLDRRTSFVPGHYGLNCTDGYTVMDVFTGVFLRNVSLQDSVDVTVPGEALNTEQSGRDVTLETKRQLVLNEGSIVNPSWQDAMRAEGLMDIDYADIGATLASFPQPKAGSANSIVTDYFNYKGLWQTAFPSASIQRERFYDEQGRHIGEVKMMRIKMKASLAHLPFMDSKALVLPVGVDGRYKMLITLGIGHNPIRNMISTFMGAILQIFSLLKTSLVPIEIAIPQIEMTSEFDVRPLLEEMGFDALFNDPAATTFVSQPPALPAVLTQHVRVDIGPNGINPPPRREITNPISGLLNIASNIGTGLAAAVGHDFIANKPFLFALYDTKSDTCLFAGAYARPSI